MNGDSTSTELWVVAHIGCLECGYDSQILGVYTSMEAAVASAEVETGPWWSGDETIRMFPIPAVDTPGKYEAWIVPPAPPTPEEIALKAAQLAEQQERAERYEHSRPVGVARRWDDGTVYTFAYGGGKMHHLCGTWSPELESQIRAQATEKTLWEGFEPDSPLPWAWEPSDS